MPSRALHPDRCWFHSTIPGLDPCEGRTDRCHLVRAQVVRREAGPEHEFDPRIMVPGCRRHHSMLDQSRQIRVPRWLLPVAVECFAREHGLEWWLDRTYGEATA